MGYGQEGRKESTEMKPFAILIAVAFLALNVGCAFLNELDRAAYQLVDGLDKAAGRALGIQATPPAEERYSRLSWATTTVGQAEAECYAEIQKNPLLGLPTCMRAKGWQER